VGVKPIWKGSRDFITRGNPVEIAVAFVIRGAFGTVGKAFSGDVIMPTAKKCP